MKKVNFGFLMVFAAIAILCITAVSTSAVAADNDVLREIQDREQIRKLMWDYARALDTFNAEAFTALFTEDGQFGRGENAVKGREALFEMIAAFGKGSTAGQDAIARTGSLYHMTANHYIEFVDRDNAVFHAYWVTFMSGGGENPQPTTVGVGREVNEVVRVDGKWLIRVRDIVPRD